MNKKPQIAMYQPDIPQNVGAMMRLCACLGVSLDIIEPCGFPWESKKIRQSAMDYYDNIDLTKHQSAHDFFVQYKGRRRIILMTTKSQTAYTDVNFRSDDILLAGRESAGVPNDVHKLVDMSVHIPMMPALRSLNIVSATSMILGEALRQTGKKQ